MKTTNTENDDVMTKDPDRQQKQHNRGWQAYKKQRTQTPGAARGQTTEAQQKITANWYIGDNKP